MDVKTYQCIFFCARIITTGIATDVATGVAIVTTTVFPTTATLHMVIFNV